MNAVGSRITKFAKILALEGQVRIASYGVPKLLLCLFLIILLTGCSWFADNRQIKTKPTFHYSEESYKEMLSEIIRLRLLQTEAEKYGVALKDKDEIVKAD